MTLSFAKKTLPVQPRLTYGTKKVGGGKEALLLKSSDVTSATADPRTAVSVA